jgi:dTDP-4-dehydrorhamnose 3,5-epimerase
VTGDLPPHKTLVVGAGGQLGRALRVAHEGAAHVEFAERTDIDLTSGSLVDARRWRDYDTIVNAAAYTAVDAAETPEGRAAAWAVNVAGTTALARIATEHGITLIHVSSDYVFDGTATRAYTEDDPVAPLSVYGQTKAAADYVVATVPRHYVIRTSWVIGDGRNFVSTMLSLAERGVDPAVVDDQRGRLTFTADLARAIGYLAGSRAPYGVYNVTGAGATKTWADVARSTFALAGHDPSRVTGVSTRDYFAQAAGPVAPRPGNSELDLAKITAAGFTPADTDAALAEYVERYVEGRASSGG